MESLSPWEEDTELSEDDAEDEEGEDAPLENPKEEEPEWLEWLDEQGVNDILSVPPSSTLRSETEEEERRVDDTLFDRLRSTGRLTRRRSASNLMDLLKENFLELAYWLSALESITLDVSVQEQQTDRRLEWKVVRLSERITLFDVPLPKSSLFNLEEPFCVCRWMGKDTKELRKYLEDMPPLFSLPADFTPRFTLDRFLLLG